MHKALMVILILLILTGCAPGISYTQEQAEYDHLFGDIAIYEEEAKIRFPATINKEEGWVQHLIYLQGYQWLKDKSAITTDTHLAALQKAFALLDWELWDYLWQGLDSEKVYGVRVYIYHEGEKRPASSFVLAQDTLYVGDIMFLGSPYFDTIAFGAPAEVDCTLCPVFPLEQEALNERFQRKSGLTGYDLNENLMPAKGSKVEVIIYLPRGE